MKLKLFLLSLLFVGSLSAQNKLTIIIEGVEKVKGNMMVALHTKDSFMKEPFIGKIQKVDGAKMTVVMEDIPDGKYAVALFQDENEDRKLNTGMFGIPKEKYGFSKNPKIKRKAPSFEECVFELKEDFVVYIVLN